jgi:hypothetical protein
MEKRAFKRLPVYIDVAFHCCNKDCHGTVTNMSEKGMLIRIQNVSFSCLSQIELSLLLKKGAMRVPGKIVRLIKSPDARDEFGYQLEHPHRQYLDFVNSLKSLLQ